MVVKQPLDGLFFTIGKYDYIIYKWEVKGKIITSKFVSYSDTSRTKDKELEK